MKKNIITGSLAIMGVAGASIWGFAQLDNNHRTTAQHDQVTQYVTPSPQISQNGQVDFTAASESSVKSVVHITTKKEVSALTFYGYQSVPQTGSGSGVIISRDGYIVTNYHVVEKADEVKVTLSNNKSYIGKVVGTDPSTDLAVLKVEGGQDFPYLAFGDSDALSLGQWVLAVGYPFNLDVTVTAGIVSAKSRNIGVNNRQSRYAIESFIQTDAAVNMGNSGGALVNTNGHLIGINSAIATPTGAYAGYSYAIPSNLVRKVVEDIIAYGEVQRGFVGASFVDLNMIDEKMSSQFGVSSQDYNNISGILVTDIVENSGAEAAGLQKGDIITEINGKTLRNSSQMMEMIGQRNPGDKMDFTVVRNSQPKTMTVTLKSRQDVDQIAKSSSKKNYRDQSISSAPQNADLGLELGVLSQKEKDKYGLSGGVVVNGIKSNSTLRQFTNIKEGFLITKINGREVNDADEALALLSDSKNIRIEGTYPGTNSYQSFSFRSIGR